MATASDTTISPSDLAALEIIDAAGAALAVGRVEATGLVLMAHGALRSAETLSVIRANGSRARSDDLVCSLLSAVKRGYLERRGDEFILTDHGRSALTAMSSRASEEARQLAQTLAGLDPISLSDEADRVTAA